MICEENYTAVCKLSEAENAGLMKHPLPYPSL